MSIQDKRFQRLTSLRRSRSFGMRRAHLPRILWVGLLAAVAVIAEKSSSSPCAPLTEITQARLVAYVAKLVKASSATAPQLLSVEPENDSCFRRLIFSTTDRKTKFALFLSPDQQFLVPQLFDSNIDPVIAEAKSIEKTKVQIDDFLTKTKTPMLGAANASVTIAVFSDFQCPFCRRAMKIVETEILPKMNGQVRLAYINYPLSEHPWAREAALSLSCVANQDPKEFWRLHDYVFEHQSEVTPGKVSSLVALQLKIDANQAVDLGKIDGCIRNQETASEIQADTDFGSELRVAATPTFFINGKRLVGLQNADQITSMIDALTTSTKPHNHSD